MWDYDADLKYYGKHETLINIHGLCFVFCLVYAVYGNISLAVSSSDPDTPLTTVCI